MYIYVNILAYMHAMFCAILLGPGSCRRNDVLFTALHGFMHHIMSSARHSIFLAGNHVFVYLCVRNPKYQTLKSTETINMHEGYVITQLLQLHDFCHNILILTG